MLTVSGLAKFIEGKRREGKDVSEELFKPLAIFSGEEKIDQVRSKRMRAKTIMGVIVAIDANQQKMLRPGMVPYLELPVLDEKGKTGTSFKIGLTDGRQDFYAGWLKLSAGVGKYFTLVRNNGNIVLNFKEKLLAGNKCI